MIVIELWIFAEEGGQFGFLVDENGIHRLSGFQVLDSAGAKKSNTVRSSLME